MKIVYFDYGAVLIIFTLLISLILQKRTRGKANRAFIATIIEILCTSLVGIVTLTLDNLGAGHLGLKQVFHSAYLLLHNYTALFFLYYVLTLSDTWYKIEKNKLKYLYIFIPSIIITVLIIINFFKPIVFYFNEQDLYSRTKVILLFYLIGVFNLAITLVYLFKYKDLFNKKVFISIFLLFPVIFLSMIFEFFIPNVVVEPFANTLGLLFISYTIQRPEELNDSSTGLGNLNSYTEDCRKIFRNKKSVQQIFINVINYDILKDIVGYESGFVLSAYFANVITSLNSSMKLGSEIYYIGKGKFRLIVDEDNFAKVLPFADAINTELKKYISVHSLSVKPVVNVCIIKCPDEIDAVDTLILFGEEIDNQKYHTGYILYAKEIFNKDYMMKLLKIDNLIEKAFVENRFEVYYQPIYSVKTGRFSSAEALLRLKDSEYGFISPEIFIPAAERSGAIHRIDNMVLETVCKFIASDDFSKLKIDYIEINLSVTHCMQDNITEQVFDMLTKYKINPDKINLEVTETEVAMSEEKFLNNLDKLTKNKVKISLDDFGSGYSNLKRLSRLPLTIVKIDKSITDEITNEKVSVVFNNLTQMMKSLNLEIVVEGVETKEVYEYFKKAGCDYIQGFYFSKPLPKNEYIQFLQKNNG